MLIEAAWSYQYPARIAKEKAEILVRLPKNIRDIAWKAQTRLCTRYRSMVARGKKPTVVVAAIALWNAVYLERAISALQERSYVFDQKLLVHLSPLKWEHINLTGDYHWRRDGGLRNRKLRPVRSQPLPDFAS